MAVKRKRVKRNQLHASRNKEKDEQIFTSDPSVSVLESTLFDFFFDAAEDLDFFFDGCFVSTSSAKANKSLNLFPQVNYELKLQVKLKSNVLLPRLLSICTGLLNRYQGSLYTFMVEN